MAIRKAREAVHTPAKTARTRLEVDQRRSQLIALGLQYFSTRPYDDVSIEDFARGAGISKGLLYHYFPTKRDFYVASLREAARQLIDRTDTSHAADRLDRLREGLDAYLNYVDQHGPAYAALLGGGIGSDPEVSRIIQETRATFVSRMMREVGTADPTPLLRAALRGWAGFVEVASLDWVVNKDVDRVALRDLMIHQLLGAMSALVQPAP